MRHEVIELEVKQANESGAPIVVDRFREKTVHVHAAASFSASLQVEGVIGNEDWTAIGTALTANGFVLVPQAVTKLRITTSGYTSGAPKAHFGGFDSRTDGT